MAAQDMRGIFNRDFGRVFDPKEGKKGAGLALDWENEYPKHAVYCSDGLCHAGYQKHSAEFPVIVEIQMIFDE